MDEYNKGRLIPNIRPLSEFRQADSRSPFDGEVIYDDTDGSYDLGFWAKNMNNVWECHMRTKEIQQLLDSYGTSGDNTFQNATAFYESGVIHKFFFSQKGQRVWLDKSFDISKFAYYAIKSVNNDNGKKRYVTGLVDSDGSNYLDALIPVSMKYGKLTREVFINTWYIVEFYNEAPELLHSLNYLSPQALPMPIDLINEPLDRENTVTNVKLTFDRVDKDGKGILYKGESVNDIHPHLQLTISDGHIVILDDVDKIELQNLYNVNTNQIGEYSIKAKYKVFDNDEASSRKIFKYFKDIIFYYDNQTQKPYVRVTVPKIEEGMYNREYKEVRVRGIGNEETKYVTDFQIEQDDNGNDVILISHEYFKIEKNSVIIYYVETTDASLIKSTSLYIPVENIIKVVEPEEYTYEDFKAIGYIANVGGENKVMYEAFVIRNGITERITNLVEFVYPPDYESGRVNRVVARFKGHEEAFFSYFKDPNVAGNTRVLTSKSRADLGSVPENLNTPILLHSTGYSDFTLGLGSFSGYNATTFESIISLISPNVDLIRIRSVKLNRYVTHFVRENSFTYIPVHSIFVRIPNNAKTVRDITSNISTPENHSVSYRLIKCKNKVLTNWNGSRTIKEMLQMIPVPSDSFGTFIGYSISNGWLMNDEESERIIENGKKLYYYEWFAVNIENINNQLPSNFDGLIEFRYTLNRITVSNNDCFLIEGYNSSNKNKCLGSVIAHAAVRI